MLALVLLSVLFLLMMLVLLNSFLLVLGMILLLEMLPLRLSLVSKDFLLVMLLLILMTTWDFLLFLVFFPLSLALLSWLSLSSSSTYSSIWKSVDPLLRESLMNYFTDTPAAAAYSTMDLLIKTYWYIKQYYSYLLGLLLLLEGGRLVWILQLGKVLLSLLLLLNLIKEWIFLQLVVPPSIILKLQQRSSCWGLLFFRSNIIIIVYLL
jgi:hypothetical protein